MNVLALEFPPVSHLFEWPDFLFSGTAYASWRLARSYGADLEKARIERRAAWQAEGPLA